MKSRFFILIGALCSAQAGIGAPLHHYTSFKRYSIVPSEASAITYNKDTGTLFTIGDEGHELCQINKTGGFIDKMSFNNRGSAGNRALDDPEGVTYLGNGRFMIADERIMTGWLTPYNPGTEVDVGVMTGYIFSGNSGNSGLEGVAYDPINHSVWGVQENLPLCVFELSNFGGSGTPVITEPFATRFFNRTGIIDIADVYVMAESAAFGTDDPRRLNILVLSQESNVILEMTRAGQEVNRVDISSLGAHSIEGMTMDENGTIYLVSETTLDGGGSTMFVLNVPEAPTPYTLQLLHLADEEAGLLASQTAPNLAALVDGFDGTHTNTLILSGGDSFIPSPFLNGGTDPSLSTVPGIGATAFARPDYAVLNALGVEASAIGNHEWDLGTAVFADAIRPVAPWVGAQFPHITANLDFSMDSAISGANAISVSVPVDGTGTAVPETSVLKGKIVPTAVITKGGEKIGLVGVTTQLIESISSPSGTKVKGQPGVDNMDLLATQVQPFIDELTAEGVNKIILLSHLQQITNEQSLATKLHGVDIILAAGSNTRLGDADDVAVAFAGHAADFAGTYPLRTAGTDGKPMLIVNTDNEFTYLGRLVVDFTPQGEVILESLDSRVAENGAYASTAANVAAAWNTTVENLATTAFAPGSKGAQVKAITDAVQGVINAKDGTVHGYTTVYLEGERAQVRSEETNLGDITADANANALRAITGSTAPIVSLKNGGGIRAQIGAVSSAGGSAIKLPPPANPAVGKLEGGISQLDIENALRFDNKLIAFDTTPAGLKAILEHGVAAWPNQGRFPQVGGVSFSWDPALPSGNRLRAISLIGRNGEPEAALYQNGAFIGNAPSVITMVTLNFLANDGDGYPMKANGENFRYLLANGTLGPVLDETLNFTVSPSLPANPVGEQKVFADYLTSRYPTVGAAYTTADTASTADLRVQILSARADEVLPYTPTELRTLNTFADALRALGLSPSVALTSPSFVAAIGNTLEDAKEEVIGNPAAHGLYTATSIQDLRGTGVLIQAEGNEVNLRLPVESSATLGEGTWVPAGELETTLPKIGDKAFYRLTLPQN